MKKVTTIERRKSCKIKRNHLMVTDDKSASNHKSEKLKLKDCADVIPTKKRKINTML